MIVQTKNIINKGLNKLNKGQLIFIVFAFSFVTKTFLVFLLGNDANLHPDMKIYLSFSNQIAQKGIVNEYVIYSLKHNYTFIFGLFLSPISMIFGSSTQVLNIYLSLLLSISSVLFFDILDRYVSTPLSFVGIMIYNIMPIGLFQTQLLIHENAILFCHILSIWLFLKVFDEKRSKIGRIVFLVLASLIISFGSKINMSGIIMIISFVIYSVLVLLKKMTLRNIMKVLCVVISLIISFVAISSLCNIASNKLIDKSSVTYEKKSDVLPFGFGWGLYVGFNYDSKGTISNNDSETYYKNFDNINEEKEYKMSLIKDRVSNCAENPLKLGNHFLNKLQIMWGMPFLPFAYEQGNSVNNFILRGAGGCINKILTLGNMLVLLFVYFMIFISSLMNIIKKKYNISIALHLKMVIIGITLLFILVEVTPKYTSHLPILMVGIWILQLKDYCDYSLAFNRFVSKKVFKKTISSK